MIMQALTEEVKLGGESLAAYKKSASSSVQSGVNSSPKSSIGDNPRSSAVNTSSLSEITAAVEAFIKYDENIGRSPATVETSRHLLRYWQSFLQEQKIEKLAAVTPQVVANYQAWIFNSKTRFGKSYGLQSQIVILNTVQVFCKYLLLSGKILSNPAEFLKLPKEPKRLPGVILTPLEMKKLLAQPDTSTVLGFRDRTMYEVLYSTGIRIGELLRLQVQDISLEQGTIFISSGKGLKDRVVPLGETAGKYLVEYVQRIRPMFRQSACENLLFFNKAGKLLKKSGVWKKLMIYAQRAGIKKHVTVHTFRHTLATEMLRRGADLRQIQELLGHANLRTTQLYTHIVKGELRRVQAECHPREQTALPENFVRYRGRKYLTADEIRKPRTSKQNRTNN